MVRVQLNVAMLDGSERHFLAGEKRYQKYRPEKGMVKYRGNIFKLDPRFFYRDTWRMWTPIPFYCHRKQVFSIDYKEGDGDPKLPLEPVYHYPDEPAPKNSSSGWAIWSEDQSMTRIWSGQKIDAMAIIAIILVFAVILLAAPNIGKLFGR